MLAAWACIAYVTFATLSPIEMRMSIGFDPRNLVEHFGAFLVIALLLGVAYPRRAATVLILAIATGLANVAVAGPKGCPPGLAKKSIPCVPRARRRNGRSASPCRAAWTTWSWTRTTGGGWASAIPGRGTGTSWSTTRSCG